jgi:hypothetical protein
VGDPTIVVGTIIAYHLIVKRQELRQPGRDLVQPLRCSGRRSTPGVPAVHQRIVHYGFLHIAFNMFVLYQVGIFLEPATGARTARLSTSCRCSAAPRAAILLDPNVYTGGASGGVFGRGRGDAALHRQG